MAKNTLQDLRDHLFATLEALSDDEKPMELDRAKAICQVSEKIIDSAKVEVDFLDVVGGFGDQHPAERFFGKNSSNRLPTVPTGGTLPS